MPQIARLTKVWRAPESTKGTKVAVTKCISATSVSFRPIAVKGNDEGSLWTIDILSQQDLTQTRLEVAVEGILKPNNTSDLFRACLGTVNTTWSDPYVHTLTLKNDNDHPAYTIYHEDVVGKEAWVYCMLSELTLSAQVENHVTYNSSWLGQQLVASTDTPTYDNEESFIARQVTIEIADDIAWLDSPTTINARSLNLTFNKNVLEDFKLWKLEPFNLYNQWFAVSGDIELTMTNRSFRDLTLNNTKKAMRITITWDEVIDETPDVFNTIVITMWSVAFEDWDHSTSNDDIVTNTVWFIKEKGEPTNIQVVLTNTRAVV